MSQCSSNLGVRPRNLAEAERAKIGLQLLGLKGFYFSLEDRSYSSTLPITDKEGKRKMEMLGGIFVLGCECDFVRANGFCVFRCQDRFLDDVLCYEVDG